MSSVWDRYVVDPSGKTGAFWTVQESTTGGAQQNTQWIELGNPFPQFAGVTQSLASCTSGTTCPVTVKAPANSRAGDVFAVTLGMGEDATATLPTVPSGWNFTAYANQGFNQVLLSTDSCKIKLSSWLLLHVYGGPSSDSGSYTFTHSANSYSTSCLGTVIPNLFAFLANYRGANQTDGSTGAYCVNGWPGSSDSSSFSTGGSNNSAFSPSYVSQVLNIFVYNKLNNTLSQPQGTPAVTVEANGPGGLPFLAADVAADAAGLSLGPYTDTASPGCVFVGGCIWFAYQMALELP